MNSSSGGQAMKYLIAGLVFVSVFFCSIKASAFDLYADIYQHTRFPGDPDFVAGAAIVPQGMTRNIYFGWYVEADYLPGDTVTFAAPAGWIFRPCSTFDHPDLDRDLPTVDADMNLEVDGYCSYSGNNMIYNFTEESLWNPMGFTESWVVPNPFEVCVKVTAPNYADTVSVMVFDSNGEMGLVTVISQ